VEEGYSGIHLAGVQEAWVVSAGALAVGAGSPEVEAATVGAGEAKGVEQWLGAGVGGAEPGGDGFALACGRDRVPEGAEAGMVVGVHTGSELWLAAWVVLGRKGWEPLAKFQW